MDILDLKDLTAGTMKSSINMEHPSGITKANDKFTLSAPV